MSASAASPLGLRTTGRGRSQPKALLPMKQGAVQETGLDVRSSGKALEGQE